MSTDWHLLAWQGIQIDVPVGWELGLVSGDMSKGYCRIDDQESTRLEIRWLPARSSAPIGAHVDEYIKQSGLDKKDLDITIRRDLRLVKVPDMETEFFLTRGQHEAMHMASHCSICDRIVFVRVIYSNAESMRPKLQRIFGSFRDHAKDGLLPWSLYGIRFDLPSEYTLRDQTLKTGRMELEFEAGKRLVQIARISLAEMALRKKSLLEWAQGDPIGKFTHSSVEWRQHEWLGHPAVQAAGRRRRHIRRFFRLGFALRLLVWHCPDSNAIFVMKWTGPDSALEEFQPIVNSLSCHTVSD